MQLKLFKEQLFSVISMTDGINLYSAKEQQKINFHNDA